MEYYFEPNPIEVFSYIIPLYLKVRIYTCFLESSFSEQFARRVAMKNATDASTEMIRDLTILTTGRGRQRSRMRLPRSSVVLCFEVNYYVHMIDNKIRRVYHER